MANETIQIRVTRELKEEAEAVFKSIGLKTSEAIRLFLQQSVNTSGLPFQPVARQTEHDPMAALKEPEAESLDSPGEGFKTWYAD